ncbi:MAG: Ig-like domain-containing protein [Pseudomonadales bacterium]|nr:Ig-like domain-containing protein [Pseudomonadales bacterium]
MGCRRQCLGLESSGIKARVVAWAWGALAAVITGHAQADSSMRYDPFDVPQGAYQASHIRDTDNVSIIEFSGNYDKSLPSDVTNSAARAVVAREFYRTHADEYDFLVVFTDFEFDTGDALAFFNPVRNDIQGIGLPQFDLSNIYGSDGQLQGYLDMAAFSRYELDPLQPGYEQTLMVMAHETLHRWGVYVRFQDETGQPNSSLLGHQEAHWSFLAHTGASVEYGHDWKDLGNGLFKALSARRFYGPMDLYLMGFYGPDEVPPFFYIDSDERTKTDLPEAGVTVTGIAKPVTVDDVIAVEGPRIPSYQDSQKTFKFAFIYLKSPSTEVDSKKLVALSRLRETFATRFAILTGGRSIAQVYPQARPVGEIGESDVVTGGPLRTSPSAISEALMWLRNAQYARGYWQDRVSTRSRDTAVLHGVMTTYDSEYQRSAASQSWLAEQTGLNTDSLARRLPSHTSAENRVADVDTLLSRQNTDGGWGYDAGYQSDVMDTALVLRALSPYVDSGVRSAAVDYLLSAQGADGGWPTGEEGSSQVTATALALDALRETGIDGESLSNGVRFLQNQQQGDGGFGVGESTVHDTAHVIETLLRTGHLGEIDLARASSYLSSQQSVAGDWGGSVYTTALAVSALQSANFANWVITELAVSPDSPRDGERVRLSATVANDGQEESEPTVLRVYRGESPDPGQQLSEDIPVPAIPPGHAVAVDYYWDTLDSPGESRFTLAVDPDDAVIERSELDNLKTVSVSVAEAADGVDLELNDGAVSVTPAEPSYLPTDLSISIAVRNAGREAATGALVRVLKVIGDGEPTLVGESVVAVPARQSTVVNFVAQQTVATETRYLAVVDPEATIDEADEDNNTGEALIQPRESIDFVVNDRSVSVEPAVPLVGEDATFTVVVRNQGTLMAPPSTVRYTMLSDGQEKELLTSNIMLGAGESVTHTLPWRVDSTGPKTLIVEVDPAAQVSETDEDNNRLEYTFTADVIEGSNVRVLYSDITVSPQPLLEGYGATATATVKNNGTEDVAGVDVAFFEGNPETGGVELGRTTLASLPAGERAEASVAVSRINDGADLLLYVQLDPADKLVEFDEQDNLAFETFPVTPLPDLVLGDGSIALDPPLPKQGESVQVTVTVNNAGIQSAQAIPVELYEGLPGQGGVLIGDVSIAELPGQQSESVTFDYSLDAQASETRLVAWVNRDQTILEQSQANNRGERRLTLQNSNAYVTERYISPDGDGQQDTTEFYFRLDEAADVSVVIVDQHAREVRRLTDDRFVDAVAGSVTWDGRNSLGAIVRDGDYDVRVQRTDGAILGETTVVVDTNRSPLLKALDTEYELVTNIRELLSDPNSWIGGLTYSPDDEYVYFLGKPRNENEPYRYAQGIYRATAYGGQVTPILIFDTVEELRDRRIGYSLALSPQGNTIVFPTEPRGNGARDFWSLDLETGAANQILTDLDKVVEYQGQTYAPDWDDACFLSVDGKFFYFFKKFQLSDGSNMLELGRVSTTGGALPEAIATFATNGQWSISELARSPVSNDFYVQIGGDDWSTSNLFVFSASSGEIHQIEPDIDQRVGEMAWAPDGSRFAYYSNSPVGLSVRDAKGTLISRHIAMDSIGEDFWSRGVHWNTNSIEVAYGFAFDGGGEAAAFAGTGADWPDGREHRGPESIYLFNTVTGNARRLVEIFNEFWPAPLRQDQTLPSDWPDGLAISIDSDGRLGLPVFPRDWGWAPGEDRLLLLHGLGGKDLDLPQALSLDVRTKGQVELHLYDWPDQIYNLDVSSTERRLFLGDIAVESLLNLSLDLRALRSPSAGGIQLSGTASDLNFDHYALDYSTTGEAGSWQSVVPDSILPKVDDDMAVWVPPAPGSYYLRLTGQDKAGNVRRNLRRTSWGERTALTDLYREPGYMSPNGDGNQDAVSIKFRVLQPVNLTLDIYNEEGGLVRTIQRSFDLIGARESITWDGRDDTGVVVDDGVYKLKLGRYSFEVVLDNTAPVIKEPYIPDLLKKGCDYEEGNGNICTSVADIDLTLSADFFDENYYRHRLEHKVEGHGWFTRSSTKSEDESLHRVMTTLSTFELASLDRKIRLVVEDLAGNTTVMNFDLEPKSNRLILVEGTQGQVFSERIPFSSYGSIPGRPLKSGFSTTVITAIESVQRPIVSVSLQYRDSEEPDDTWQEMTVTDFMVRNSMGKFLPGERTDTEFNFLLHADQFDPAKSYEVLVKLVDDLGNAFISNGIYISSYLKFGISGVYKLPTPKNDYQVSLKLERVPKNIVDKYVLVQSDDDSRYSMPTRIDHSFLGDQKIFMVEDLIPCKNYFFTLVLVDNNGKEYHSPIEIFTPDCAQIIYTVEPVIIESCSSEPSNQLNLSARLEYESEVGIIEPYEVLRWESLNEVTQEYQVLFTQNNPQLGVAYSHVLETKKLEEGAMQLRIVAVKESSESIQEHVVVPIDHTAPEILIQSPITDGKVCAIEFLRKLESGGVETVRGALIQGEVTDVGGTAVDYQVIYHSENGVPKNVTDLLPMARNRDTALTRLVITNDFERHELAPQPSTSPVPLIYKETGEPLYGSPVRRTPSGNLRAFGRIGLVTLNGTSEIDYTFQLSDFGTHYQCVSSSFNLDASIEGMESLNRNNLISPNSDGLYDMAEIELTHDEDVFVDLALHQAVLDSKSQAWKVAAESLFIIEDNRQLPAGNSELIWDGRRGGEAVADGNYFLVATVRDGCGNTETLSHFLVIDTTPPSLALTYPQQGDPTSLSTAVLGSAVDNHFQSYRLELESGHTGGRSLIRTAAKPVTENTLAVWNTFGISGDVTLVLTATDRAGNTAEIRSPLTLAERSNLLSYLETDTPYFSPNGDGAIDLARVKIGFLSAANFDVVLQQEDGTVIGSLATGLTAEEGEYVYRWDGTLAGQPVVDGRYLLEVVAHSRETAGFSQTETITLSLDNTAPTVDVHGISGGFLMYGKNLMADVLDDNFGSYSYFSADDPSAPLWTKILDRSEPGRALPLAVVSPETVEEGAYAAKVVARDLAGNVTETVIPYVVDFTKPEVSLTSPQAGAVKGTVGGPLAVEGGIQEANLAIYRILFRGAGSDLEQRLLEGNEAPGGAVMAQLDLTGLPEGRGALVLEAVDRAGQTGRAELDLIIDNTAPALSISDPVNNGYITGLQAVTGSVDEDHLESYVVELASGAGASNDAGWTTVVRGTSAVVNGNLAYLSELPQDGAYTLRLRAADQAGNEASTQLDVQIDTHPPGQPVLDSVSSSRDEGINLSWTAVADDDLKGYLVERGGSIINSEPVNDTVYLDPLLGEGTYSYRIIAVDHAGNRSLPSEAKQIRVDWTPPKVAITNPNNGAMVSGLVDIRGTAHSDEDFSEYRLSIGAGDAPSGWQEISRSSLPRLGAELAQWDSLVAPGTGAYTIRLEAEDLAGNVGETRVTVTIDNEAPAAPTGLTATVTGLNDIQFTWNANTEPDLAGYYLFSQGGLINADGAVVGDMTPYLLERPEFMAPDVPDGSYEYYVYAADTAGNISDSSQPVTVEIETGPPEVFFLKPEDGDLFEDSLHLEAESLDNDLAQVGFDYRLVGTTDWLAITRIQGDGPYVYNWDTSDLPYAEFEVRLQASDRAGNSDPTPDVVQVEKQDLTRPNQVIGLELAVDADSVSLNWEASDDADLAGYLVERIDAGQVTELTPDPITSTSFIDSGLDVGDYQYRVRAEDLVGNRGEFSEELPGTVFRPLMEAPFSPITSTKMTISGVSPDAIGGQAEASLDTILGQQGLPDAAIDGDGNFSWPEVVLQPGANDLSIRTRDPDDNRSIPLDYRIHSVTQPDAPTGLVASASGFDVELGWDPVVDPDVLGYRVFTADGEPLSLRDRSAIASAEGEASSSSAAAANVIDGSIYSFFQPASSGRERETLTVTLDEKRYVSGIGLVYYYSNRLPANYDVEVWTGDYWLKLVSVRNGSDHTPVFDQPYLTDKVRIVYTEYCGYSCRVGEFRVYKEPFVTATEYLALNQDDGQNAYYVTTLSQYGIESEPSELAQVGVGDVIAPEPVVLSGELVNDHDARLSWSASASADVTRYRLYRNGDLEQVTDQLNYADQGLKNGDYTYHIVAEDQVGNLSDASNSVMLSVSTSVAAAPTGLEVVAPPGGGQLNLSWQHGDPDVAGFIVQRSESDSGPFERQIQTSQYTYLDDGLTNGTRYYYQVVAVDAVGNESLPSEVASGVPMDSVQPRRPRLVTPVVDGQTVEVSRSSTHISGIAEPGVDTGVFLNGVLASRVLPTDKASLHRLHFRSDFPAQVSPSGEYAVGSRYSETQVVDVRSGRPHWFSAPMELADPAWVSDTTFVGIGWDYGDPSACVYIIDIEIDAANQPCRAIAGYVGYRAEFSLYAADADVWLVFVSGNDANKPPRLLQLDTSDGSVIRAIELFDKGYLGEYLTMSPDGRRVAWVDTGASDQIAVLDLDTGNKTVTHATGYDEHGQIAWRPDSSGFAFVHSADDSVAYYDLQTQSLTTLQASVGLDILSVRWAYGSTILYGSDHAVYSQDLDSQEATELFVAEGPGESLYDFTWSDALGAISVLTRNNDARLLTPAGYFRTPMLALQEGENTVFALSEDEAGNESEASAVAKIIYNPSNLPDLKVSASARPAIAVAGSTIVLNAVASNSGAQQAPGSTLTVAVLYPDGHLETLIDQEPIAPLVAGTSISRDLAWSVPEVVGSYNLIASVDDLDEVIEASESNNTVIQSLPVVDNEAVVLSGGLNRSVFMTQEDLTAELLITNPGEAFDGRVSAWVEDADGYRVISLLDNQTVTVATTSTADAVANWNTGTTYPGSYAFKAALTDSDGNRMSHLDIPFEIVAQANPLVAVGSDRATYGANADVAITAHVSNPQANMAIQDATLGISVLNDQDETLWQTTVDVAELLPSDTQAFSARWNSGAEEPGTYTIQALLQNVHGEDLAASSNIFNLQASDPSLPADLIVPANAEPVGSLLVPEFVVTNQGNASVDDLELVLQFVRVADGSLLLERQFASPLAVGESFSGQSQLATDGLPLGTVRIQLLADYRFKSESQRRILATEFVELFDATAPNVAILAPLNGSVVNSVAAKAVVAADDPLSGLADVLIQLDAGNWRSIPFASVNYLYDLSNLTEGVHTLRAKAVDHAGNVSEIQSASFEIDNEALGIQISGVEHNGFYRAAVTPVVVFEGETVASVQLNGSSFISGTQLSEDGSYHLEAFAEDSAGNQARSWVDFVLDSKAPIVTVEGIEDEGLYREAVTPEIVVTDDYLESVNTTLNGESYRSGTAISDDDEYQLVVTALDKAGNRVERTYVFEIDQEAPDAPIVITPEDNDVLLSNDVAVTGEAEPLSVIDLTVGGETYSTLTDAVGKFAYTSIILPNGVQQLELTATDRAGNVSEPTTLQVTVQPEQQLSVVGSPVQRSHVLVWIPESDNLGGTDSGQDEFDGLVQLVGETYELGRIDYRVVRHEDEFIHELRSQRYNVLLIGSLKPALGNPLSMSFSTEREIKSVVGGGTGLIWINNHTHLFELWRDMIGARSFGPLEDIQAVHLDESPASSEGVYSYDGHHGVRVIMTGGIAIGQLELPCKPHWHLFSYHSNCSPGWWFHNDAHINPALVVNKYGAGSVAMFTFNPDDLQGQQVANNMLMEVTAYATPPLGEAHDEMLIDIDWRISEAELPLNAAAIQRLNDAFVLESVEGGEVTDKRTATWNRELTNSQAVFSSQVRVDGIAGDTATADFEIYDSAIGAGSLLGDADIAVTIGMGREQLELSYMDALDSIDYSLFEFLALHNSMVLAQSALARDIENLQEVDKAIWEIKKSLGWLQGVDDDKTGEAIIAGGLLLKHYQALWHSFD